MKKSLTPLLFSGTSHPALAREVAKALGVELGKISLKRFPDGETSVEILEEVHGRDVFLLQTVALDPNEYLMEMLIMVDALKRSSVRQIVAIIPYFGYCRQDRKDRPGVPITAKLVANMLSVAGVTRLVTIDLHAGQLEGFFEIPVDHFRCQPLLAKAVSEKMTTPRVVVAPDVGSAKIAKKTAALLGAEMAVIEKQRVSASEVKMMLIGHVEGKTVLIADDMCSTATTLVEAAKVCHAHGAKEIFAAITHGLLVGGAVQMIEKSPIKTLFLTNTVPIHERCPDLKKGVILSVAPLLSETIKALIAEQTYS